MFHVVTKRKEGPKLSKMSYIDLHIEIGLFVNHFLTLQLFFFPRGKGDQSVAVRIDASAGTLC